MYSQFDNQDVQDNKLMAVLCYIGILVVIPIFAAPNSKYVRYHANQGLCVMLAGIAAGFVCGILGIILGLVPFLGGLLTLIVGLASGIVSLIILIFEILGIVNVVKGEAKPLPIIGNFQILK